MIELTLDENFELQATGEPEPEVTQEPQFRTARKKVKAAHRAKRIAISNVESAMQLYVDLMKDDKQKPDMRKACADKIMEYAIGKAAQLQPVKEKSSNPILLRDTEHITI